VPLCKFLCSCCGHEFELFLRPSEIDVGVKCPRCQAEVKDSGPAQPDADQTGSAGCSPNKVT
jgi:putative FmdB family regulatory protein